MPIKKRYHAFYSGSVHGVGFRFTSERLASSLGISGWVRNLSDGRVELVCEGKETALAEFLKKISDVFGGYIRSADIREESYTGEFPDFDIRSQLMRYTGIYAISKESLDEHLFLKNLFTYRLLRGI